MAVKRRRTRSGKRRSPTGLRRRRPALNRLNDDQLLDLRICDLGVKIEGSPMRERVERLYEDLDRRDIRLKPHVWLSTEWFSPDGVPGIGVPFYLAHPRLTKLEEKMMLEVEGDGERECLKILRHEAGHAICNAYRLHYRKRWRELFGRFSQPYPETYKPKPDSRRFVVHLGRWYAQAHPAEDFAETFAVWLRPGSRWRQSYKGWPALKKLEYVDELMGEIAGQTPAVRVRERVEPIERERMTLREYYRRKRLWYGSDWPDFYDNDLRRIFSDNPRFKEHESAAAFIRRHRPFIRAVVAEWTGEYQYTIEQVLADMIDRCKELHLRLARPERESKTHVLVMVTVQTMNYLLGGHNRIAL